MGSSAILNTLSRREGIILDKSVQQMSRAGLVLTSISHTLNYSSIIKSNPNNSKQFSLLLGSSLLYVALIVWVEISFIYG